MSPAPHPRMHGITHVTGGPDPIPGLGLNSGIDPGDYYAAAVAIGDLVAYWRLGETGAPWADTSGFDPVNPADATLGSGGTDLTPDVTGALPAAHDDGALRFNHVGTASSPGGADWLNVTNDGTRFTFLDTDPFSVGGWAKPFANPGVNHGYMIANNARQVGSPSVDAGWSAYVVWPARTLRFSRGQAGGGAGPYYAESGVLDADEWVHWIGTYDGSNIRLYINGALAATTADTHTLVVIADVRIGLGRADAGSHPSDTSYDGWFYGEQDELAVWSKALSAEEVAELASKGAANTAAPAGDVLTADGTGGTDWAPPTILVDGGRYQEILTGSNLTSTDNLDGTVTIDATGGGGSPVDDPAVWMPLTTVVAGVPELVWDGDDQLIPTLTDI